MNTSQAEQLVEVVFRVDDPSYPFVGISEGGDTVVSLERMLPRGGGEFAEFFRITGADPDRIADLTENDDRIRETRVVSREHDGGLFEFTVSATESGAACPARDLAELGAIPTDITGVDGEGRIAVEVVGRENASELVSAFLETHPDARLVAKHGIEDKTPLLGSKELGDAIDESLTERQREVLLTAFESGYYEWPRTCTGEEVAESLGISSATFSEHIHTAERKLLELVIEGSS